MGRFRESEEGKPIDSTGGYQTPAGEWVKFNGVKDLAVYLVTSQETRDTFVERLFQYLVKAAGTSIWSPEVSDLSRSFAAYDFNIKKLMVGDDCGFGS